MTLHNASRRRFLRQASVVSGSIGAAAVPFALNLASLGTAVAQTGGDYKAIVCVFLYGGCDTSHMVLRTDAASFDEYTRLRSVAPESIALLAPGVRPDVSKPRASPAWLGGVRAIRPRFTATAANSMANRDLTFALHPSMADAASLFDSGRLAIVANAGPLLQPVSKAEYDARSKALPLALGSHNDQQSTWQALGPEGVKIGWGGRLGDLVASSNASTVFTSISLSGNAVFSAGQTVFQYQVGNSGATAVPNLGGTLFGSKAAGAVFKEIVTAENQHLFANEYSAIVKRSVDAQQSFQAAFNAASVAAPSQYSQPSNGANQNNGLAQQLQAVAKIIAARNALGARRQVFFVSMGGFDTHDNQNASQADLLARLSHALGYFNGALDGLGMSDNVTLFTASEFGRNFTSNGDGTDHGWGSHHFVMGGAVKGGEIVGRFPQFGFNLQDSAGDRFLPNVSVDQIGGTLGKWFGASDSDLDLVFPNLRNFQRNLGFMNT
jgi:uncharacterized protein (DUF1501 family)